VTDNRVRANDWKRCNGDLLSRNIQHGDGNRIPRIVEEVSAYDPDVVAVTEFRATPGIALRAAMKDRGLTYCETTNPPGSRNGIAVFSRTPLQLKPWPAPEESQSRWLDIDRPDYGSSVGILHVVAAGRTHAMTTCRLTSTISAQSPNPSPEGEYSLVRGALYGSISEPQTALFRTTQSSFGRDREVNLQKNWSFLDTTIRL